MPKNGWVLLTDHLFRMYKHTGKEHKVWERFRTAHNFVWGTTLLPTVCSLESVTCCNKLHVCFPGDRFGPLSVQFSRCSGTIPFDPLDCVGACVYERNAQDLGLLPSETVIPIISVQDKHVIIHFHVFFRGNRFLKARDDVAATSLLSCWRVRIIVRLNLPRKVTSGV